jgi:penicillin amidase
VGDAARTGGGLNLRGDGVVSIARDAHGVAHVRASTEADLYRGLGACHATDRALQLLLVRILARGRSSELLDASDEMLRIDRFFRRVNFAGGTDEEAAALPPPLHRLAAAYCDGVNAVLARRVPWELRALRYRPEPWTIADSMLVSRVIGYVALAQSQGDVERLAIELARAGVPRPYLDELFPGLLDDLDADLLALLTRLDLGETLVPPEVAWNPALPRMLASNNWVIAPRKTSGGHAILANDPHLETNRLPAVWYEAVLELGDRYFIGATLPGMPATLIGRTNTLAWGATYTFMDAVDSWIEDCRDGCYRRVIEGEERWEPFQVRTEVIKRKGKPDTVLRVYENTHGVLDGDPTVPGCYLTTRWASGAGTGAASLAAIFGLLHAPDVPAGMALAGRIETAWNWVLADRDGNIGYQMSGCMPRRRPGWNGFLPRPGWDPNNDWRGFVPPDELPRALNPDTGYIVTANDDLNHLGRARPITMPMGGYRAERIAALLAERDDWDVGSMERMQMDVVSPHAARFMEILRPLLPATPQGDVLRAWDCRYDCTSQGAYLFERFYRTLVRDVFGRSCGNEVLRFLTAETGVLADFYANFDAVLLRRDGVWYGAEGRDATFACVAAQALATEIRTWGDAQQLVMRHLVLGGRLPRWLGFDHGPIALAGGRGTIHQGQIYRSGGRETSFAPSYRFVTDLGEDSARTCLAGGPSDRRFSRWYISGVDDWRRGRFKTVSAAEHAEVRKGSATAPASANATAAEAT